MARVVSLFRHPIKGFTPESVDSLTVQADGRIAGDRVLAFRFAEATAPEHHDGLDHWPKAKGLSLQDFPGSRHCAPTTTMLGSACGSSTPEQCSSRRDSMTPAVWSSRMP